MCVCVCVITIGYATVQPDNTGLWWLMRGEGFRAQKGDQSGSSGQFTDGWADPHWSGHHHKICVFYTLYFRGLSRYLSISYLRWLLVSCPPAAVVSPLPFTLCLPLAYYSVTICPWCPRSPPSPSLTLPLSLSLSGTADGDYGPVLSFVLDPQRDLWLFGQHTAQLPISHTKCKRLSFHWKKGSCGMHIFWIYVLKWA